MRSIWVWIILGLIVALIGALTVRWTRPVVQGDLSPGDLQEALAACRTVDDSIRSIIRRTGSNKEYLRQCLIDFGGHVRIEVVNTNRLYLTKLVPGGLETRYAVTRFRGEWRAGILGPERSEHEGWVGVGGR
jgi:hypothetical protein